jgi:thiol-disulfide isomerase/thioredoxin
LLHDICLPADCPHCKSVAPIFKKLRPELGLNWTVAELDCDLDASNRAICSEYGIDGYPSIVHLRKGTSYYYSGERQLQNLLQWAREVQHAPYDPYVKRLHGGNFKQLTSGAGILVEFYAPCKLV